MSRHYEIDLPQMEDAPSESPMGDDRLQIDLRLELDEVAAVEAQRLRHSARREPTRRELVRLATKMYDARRMRDRVLEGQRALFGEPAWDMLLALYCLPHRGELMGISALTYAADVPQTTGHRWQKILLADGLIERGPDGVDLRRQIVRLTPRGRSLLERYLTRLFYCEVQVVPISDQTVS